MLMKRRRFHGKAYRLYIFSILIEDDVYLIIGFIESNHVKIIVNAKLKHIDPEIYTRKDKTYIRLNISKFDFGS